MHFQQTVTNPWRPRGRGRGRGSFFLPFCLSDPGSLSMIITKKSYMGLIFLFCFLLFNLLLRFHSLLFCISLLLLLLLSERQVSVLSIKNHVFSSCLCKQKRESLTHVHIHTCSFQTRLTTERVESFQHRHDLSSAVSFSAGSLALAAHL